MSLVSVARVGLSVLFGPRTSQIGLFLPEPVQGGCNLSNDRLADYGPR